MSSLKNYNFTYHIKCFLPKTSNQGHLKLHTSTIVNNRKKEMISDIMGMKVNYRLVELEAPQGK